MKPTPEMLEAAHERLRTDYGRYCLDELRWDYTCNISETSKEIIRQEVDRRGISMRQFDSLGRGHRREAS